MLQTLRNKVGSIQNTSTNYEPIIWVRHHIKTFILFVIHTFFLLRAEWPDDRVSMVSSQEHGRPWIWEIDPTNLETFVQGASWMEHCVLLQLLELGSVADGD
jgi:hypothetical protein